MYGGTKTEMERLLSDAQELTGVEYDISNLDDVYLAIHAVQEEMGITGTTAKEAAETVSGSFSAMTSAMKDVLGNMALGEDLGASLGALSQTFSTFLFDNLIPMVTNILSALPGAFMTLVQTLGPQFMEFGRSLIQNIGSGITTNIPQLISRGLDFLTGFSATLRENAGLLVDAGLNLVMKLAQGLVNSIPVLVAKIPQIVINIAGIINDNAPKVLQAGIRLIVMLGRGLIDAIPTIIANIPIIVEAIIATFMAFNWLNFGKNIMTFFRNGIKSMTGAVKSSATNIKNNIMNSLKQLPQNLMNLARNAGTNIANGLRSMIGSIGGASRNIGSTIINLLRNLPGTLMNLARSAGSNIASGLRSMLGSVTGAARSIGTGIVNMFKSIPSRMLSIGKNIIRGLWNGVKSMKNWVLNLIGGFADSIIGGVKGFFGIESPSKVFEQEIGKWLPEGLAVGIEGNMNPVSQAMNELSDEATGSFETDIAMNAVSSGSMPATNSTFTNQFDDQRLYEVLMKILDKDPNLYIDGKPIADILAPYLDNIDGKRVREHERRWA